jgi:diguanylate cyclase (GGDEF)-like protein/PAS domain S-box-containing protein
MISLFRRQSGNAIVQAVKTVLGGPGALADFPGPAALIDRGGRVLAANRHADAAAHILGFGTGTAPPAFIPDALETGEVVAETIVVTAKTAGQWAAAGARVEITVLPVVPGETALVLGRNLSLESALRDALVDSRRRYKELIEICNDFCWETDADGTFTFVSPRGAVGHSADELVGKSPLEFMAEPDADSAASPFAAKIPVSEIDVWFLRADGTLANLVATAIPLLDHNGHWCGARGVCRDVTEVRARDAAQAAARIREHLLAHLTRTIRDEIEPDRILQTAVTSTAKALEASGCRILRADADGKLQPAADWGTAPRDTGAAESLLAQIGAGGNPVTTEHGDQILMCIATSYRHALNGALCVVREKNAGVWSAAERTLAADVATQLGVAIAQINNQLHLEALSRTDALTGLLNRRAFDDELARRLGRGGADTAPGALLYVDLDNFKPVNDMLGHEKGDEALKLVASMLTANSRPGDLVARLGGDEFALWLERTDDESAAGRARELLGESRALAPYSGDPARPLGFSIGIAVHRPAAAETPENLIRRADEAMYAVKRDGKGGFVIAAPSHPAVLPATKSRASA